MKSEKITSDAQAARRAYDDACGAAHALDLVGERWALLVMRELFWGPKRFSDLRAGLPGLSANVLTQRLEGLAAAGVVRREKLPPPASVHVYALTDWGRESEPIFQALGRWAARSPWHDPSKPISASSLLLSFRTMVDARRLGPRRARVGLRIGAETFLLHLADGGIEIAAAPVDGADVVLAGAAGTLAAAVYGGQPMDALEKAGALRVEGDRDLAAFFTTLFPLPDKASAPP